MKLHASRVVLCALMGTLAAGFLASCAFRGFSQSALRYSQSSHRTGAERLDPTQSNSRSSLGAPQFHRFFKGQRLDDSRSQCWIARVRRRAQAPHLDVAKGVRVRQHDAQRLDQRKQFLRYIDPGIARFLSCAAATGRPRDTQFFIRQGYSRQLLYWLFVDSVEETIQGKTFGYRFDPATHDSGCAQPFGQQTKCVQDLIDIAFITGLTVETKVIDKGGGGGASKGKGGGSGGGGGNAIYSRFCFDRVLSERALKEIPKDETTRLRGLIWSTQHLPACRFDWDPAKKTAKDGSIETDTLEFDQPNTPRGTNPLSHRPAIDLRHLQISWSVAG